MPKRGTSGLRDRFRSKLKEGSNLKVLNDARRWFRTQGVNIERYFFCTENKRRNKSALDDEDLKCCEICGWRLYRMDEDSIYDTSSEIKIVQKKHLLFVDSAGGQHYTCYGLSRCLERAEFDAGEQADLVDTEFEPPSFEELAKPELNLGQLNEAVAESIIAAYQSRVVPFLKKWTRRRIDKSNVYEFMLNFRLIENKFLFLYCQSQTEVKILRNKILTIIGVRYEK